MGSGVPYKNCFLKAGLTTALLPKTVIPGRVFPSGGTGGTPTSSMSPLITSVSPHKIENLSPPPIFADHDKKFFDIFQSLHDKG